MSLYTKAIQRTTLANKINSILETVCYERDGLIYPYLVSKHIYGLSRINEFQGDKFPEVIKDVRKETYKALTPDSFKNTFKGYNAMSFLYDEGVATYESTRHMKYTFNLIVWYDYSKFKCDPDIVHPEYFLDAFSSDVRVALEGSSLEIDSIHWGREAVYSDFSMNPFDHDYMKLPYNGFRIRFSAIVGDCYTGLRGVNGKIEL